MEEESNWVLPVNGDKLLESSAIVLQTGVADKVSGTSIIPGKGPQGLVSIVKVVFFG